MKGAKGVVVRLGLALCVGAVFFEVGLRVLLTSPWTRGGALAQAVGGPSRFAFSHEDRYWRFVHRLATSERPTFEPPHDTQLGWTWPDIRPESYAHTGMSLVGGRRPVLLFGDSYSACLTGREACFEGLMARSALAESCQLLNYGVCGYGFDQTYLLTRAVAERFGEQDPVLVIGLLVDDDLSRMLLTLREYPKPRLHVEQGRIVVGGVPVRSIAQYREHPDPLPWCWSLAWLRQSLRSPTLSDPQSAESREVQELTRTMLADLVGELRARDLEHFFLLFHTAQSFPSLGHPDWRTDLVTSTLDGLGARWYDVREELARRLAEDGGAIGDFYIPDDQPGGGHYDADGNEAAFAVLCRGLAEIADLSTEHDGRPLPWAYTTATNEGGGTANYLRGVVKPFDRVAGEALLVLRAPGATPLSLRYELTAGAHTFRATLWAYQPDGESPEFTLTAALDGADVWSGSVRPGDAPLPVEFELDGAARLELRLAPHPRRGCAVLVDPTFD